MAMARLRYSQQNQEDPGLGFSLELLGYEDGKGLTYETTEQKIQFEFNFDWFDCQLSLEIFGKRIEHPSESTGSMDYQELPHFIQWLKEAQSREHGSFETVEPFFHMEVKRRHRGSMLNVTVQRSAYGVARGYLYIDSGVAVSFPANSSQIVKFADELERELMNLRTRYSKELELWNEYKEIEQHKTAKEIQSKKSDL